MIRKNLKFIIKLGTYPKIVSLFYIFFYFYFRTNLSTFIIFSFEIFYRTSSSSCEAVHVRNTYSLFFSKIGLLMTFKDLPNLTTMPKRKMPKMDKVFVQNPEMLKPNFTGQNMSTSFMLPERKRPNFHNSI